MSVRSEIRDEMITRRLLFPACPEDGCAATRGEWCDQETAMDAHMIALASGPGRMVHAGRARAAAPYIPRTWRRELLAGLAA